MNSPKPSKRGGYTAEMRELLRQLAEARQELKDRIQGPPDPQGTFEGKGAMASEDQYRLLFEGNPNPMCVYDTESLKLLAVNRAALACFGYTREELLGSSLLEFRPHDLNDPLERSLPDHPRGPTRTQLRKVVRKDGAVLDVEVSSDDVIFDGRRARLVLAYDVTNRLRAEREAERLKRAERVLSLCNETLIRARDEESLLQEICTIAVEVGGYRMAWVGFASDDEEKSITPMAHAGFENGYLGEFHLSWSDKHSYGKGPAGRAIRTGEVAAVPDLETDPSFAPWVALAKARGYRGLIALPLKELDSREPHALGVFSLYLGEASTFTAHEVQLLRGLASNLAFGIRNLRLTQEHEHIHRTVEKVAAGASGHAGKDFFEHLVRVMSEALGAEVGLVTRLLPGQPPRGRVIAGVVDGKPVDPFEYPIDGSPCERLAQDDRAVVSARVAELYPGSEFLGVVGAQAYAGQLLRNVAGVPVGQLIVLFRKPLKSTLLITSTLRIFAGRAAMELDRQVADEKIRTQASMLDSAKEAIVVRDMDFRVTYWNKGAEWLYGWRAEEAVGRSVEELVFDDTTEFRDCHQHLMKMGAWNSELKQRTKDGTPIITEAHWTLILDQEGKPQSVLAILTDISKRKALEAKLAQSQRLESIGQLTGGVAHDFNNLLTVILGNTDLLAHHLEGNPQLHRLVDMTRNAAQRGAELTHRLLSFARRQPLQPTSVDVNKLLVGMDPLLRRTLGEDIELELIQGAGLWHATVDASQLDAAVLNLCINARDAMEEGGRLTVETANTSINQDYSDQHVGVDPGQYVMVTISDTGHGIPEEHLAKVFDPFFTTKGPGKGTGLGLSMVYGFVKQSHGHIKVYSEMGQGTMVRMYLPRAHQGGESLEAPGLPLSDFMGTEKILLVEDNELVRQTTQRQLMALGYTVVAASHGKEALELLELHPDVSLLFTDVVMPGGMNGGELARIVQERRPTIKVLFTSGYTENSIVHHGRLDPGVHLLSKPYRQIDLARKVRQVLSSPNPPKDEKP